MVMKEAAPIGASASDTDQLQTPAPGRGEIIGVFVMWTGAQDIDLHPECSCTLGQHLIRDGLDAAELASRTKVGLPARLRPTVVPYPSENFAPHTVEYSRRDMGEPIKLTGSGSGAELSGRLGRLSEVISYAAGRASVKRHVDERAFLSSILAVHDRKDCLAILWQNQAAAISFGSLMDDAWEFACEVGEMVDHYVVDDGSDKFLYFGRDPKNWQGGHYGSSPFY